MKEGVWIQDPDPKPWEGKRGGGGVVVWQNLHKNQTVLMVV